MERRRVPQFAVSLADKEACETLQKKLQTAHEKFCTLAVNPCPGMGTSLLQHPTSTHQYSEISLLVHSNFYSYMKNGSSLKGVIIQNRDEFIIAEETVVLEKQVF